MTARILRRFGDAALICETDDFHEAHRLASSIDEIAWTGLEEVVVGQRSVTLVADQLVLDLDDVANEIEQLRPAPAVEREERERVIQVCFDGPDLDEVAMASGLGSARLIEAFTDARFEVAFLGFSPGFAYLVGLPEELSSIARRATPRPSVSAGSLAIGGGFAAVYPQRSPGGWRLLGRTDLPLFDPHIPPYAALLPGDSVRFVEGETADREQDAEREPLRAKGTRRIEVLHPGMLSIVEDLGRVGVARLGVPRAGAADPTAQRLSNRLVGNDETAAVIEVNASGPTLRMSTDTHVAVVGDVGADLQGVRIPLNTPIPVEAGQVLRVGTTKRTMRAYVAFGGGIDLPLLLGSRSSDVLSHLGPGALKTGDVLDIGPPVRPHGRLVGEVPSIDHHALRVVAGPDPFTGDSLDRLTSTVWEVETESDRIGVRLKGVSSIRPPNRGIASRAMVSGAIQVPPDGTPIVLMCDHATVGGYPVIATVIRADLGRLGQLGPGSSARFELVDLPTAKAALRSSEREIDQQVAGWYPVRAG